MTMRLLIAAILMVATPPLSAQPVPAITAEPDAATLAAANRLVDVVMPPVLREQMIEQSTTAMLDNLGKAMMNSPQLAPAFAKEPRARPIFERFLAANAQETRATMREMMPAMLAVMARSYARRLTVAQLDNAHDFYATPSGQAYAMAAAMVMADPEFAGLMQQSMAKAMATMPAKSKAMIDEIRALGPPSSTK